MLTTLEWMTGNRIFELQRGEKGKDKRFCYIQALKFQDLDKPASYWFLHILRNLPNKIPKENGNSQETFVIINLCPAPSFAAGNFPFHSFSTSTLYKVKLKHTTPPVVIEPKQFPERRQAVIQTDVFQQTDQQLTNCHFWKVTPPLWMPLSFQFHPKRCLPDIEETWAACLPPVTTCPGILSFPGHSKHSECRDIDFLVFVLPALRMMVYKMSAKCVAWGWLHWRSELTGRSNFHLHIT